MLHSLIQSSAPIENFESHLHNQPDDLERLDDNGLTPLALATQQQNLNLIDYLLSKS